MSGISDDLTTLRSQIDAWVPGGGSDEAHRDEAFAALARVEAELARLAETTELANHYARTTEAYADRAVAAEAEVERLTEARCGEHGGQPVNAIERLRETPFLWSEETERQATSDALAAVDALYQAAKELDEVMRYRPEGQALHVALLRVEAGA